VKRRRHDHAQAKQFPGQFRPGEKKDKLKNEKHNDRKQVASVNTRRETDQDSHSRQQLLLPQSVPHLRH
jgi:hypothetical protein